MPEEVLFEDERRQTRAEIAGALRSVADKLDAGEPVTFAAGERTVTVEPPARPTFEVKVERETSQGAEVGELSVELEFEWDEDEAAADGALSIE
ncbi:MAG: amphi-Trp domain-containing protein [Halobacteriales archaeon]